jgi:type I restriction-modification system DNA methylase subunit
MADKNGNTSANLGFEDKLWKAADALRSNMDAAEYKHVVLGLIFLKYISDAFEEQHALLEAEVAQDADPEDPDEYRAVNIFWVPKEARWSYLLANAKQPTIGKTVDDDTLKTIARELVAAVRTNVTIDWTVRENVRAHLRVIVKRILRKYGYPPDKQEKATQTVLEQAEVLSEGWAA